MNLKTFVSVAAIFALSGIALSQQTPAPTRFLHSGTPSTDTMSVRTALRDSMVRIIVEFNDEPAVVSLLSKSTSSLAKAGAEQRFSRFAADLSSIRTAGTTTSVFHHTFYKTFYGASLTVSSSSFANIRRLPYVKSIHMDKQVGASLTKSSLQLGVPAVWQTFGKQGEGIRVGIIDTGIDYLHPALGGGFGPGFKVEGGYDFVNNDMDPMDDNGHGTHVAGIVAAETDSIKGVAPKTILYAYKVLAASGSGNESDVIAAIERTVDPDDDGNPSDRLDIVNLSLGSSFGYSTDPSSAAVDNASKLGILFCIAAGNTGYIQTGGEDNFYRNGSATIGSPGTAESAITVGAVDSLDALAPFSSKGPNRNLFGLKPDVVAPGVKVLSTMMGGGYEELNGTSMATPMVAGVAALLRSIHPDWSWDRLRSSVINTSRLLPMTAFRQGAGRVQALKAASSTTWMKPPVLSFGLDDPSVTTFWTRTDTLVLYNGGASSQTFNSTVGGLQSGVAISVNPTSLTVDPGDSAIVIISLSVNNLTITTVDGDIPLFSGHILFRGDPDTLSVPWGFARTTRLRLIFNEPNPLILVYGGSEFLWSPTAPFHWPDMSTAEVYGLSKRSYEIFTQFPSATSPYRMVFKTYAMNSDAPQLAINSTEATYPVVFRGVDQNGDLLSTYANQQKALVTRLPLFGDWLSQISSSSDTVFMSPVPAAYSFRPFEFQFDGVSTNSLHIVQFPPFSGMSGPRTLTNQPDNFISQHLHFLFPPDVLQAEMYAEFSSYFVEGGQGYFIPIGYEADTMAVTNGKASVKAWFGRSANPDFDAILTMHALSELGGNRPDYSTLPIMISQDSILAITRENATSVTPRSPSGGYLTFGGPPVFVQTLWYNNIFGPGSIHFFPTFRGMQREFRYKDVDFGTYTVYDALGNEVFSNPLNDFPRSPRYFSQDVYTMVMTSGNYQLGSIQGTVRTTSQFDLATSPAQPPTVMSFLVLDSTGQPAHIFPQGADASFLFSTLTVDFDQNRLPAIDSTKAWYRVHGTQDWIPLNAQFQDSVVLREGIVFRADLTPATAFDSAAIDLRIISKDSRGFSTDMEVLPAFAVGEWAGDKPTEVKDPAAQIPMEFGLSQNFPNPFNGISNFEVRVPNWSEVRISVFDLLGREIAVLLHERKSPGIYMVPWNSGNTPSGVYFVRMEAGATVRTVRAVLVK